MSRVLGLLLCVALVGGVLGWPSYRSTSSGLSCLNESGAPVDWWIALKYAPEKDDANPDIQAGYGYAYLDSVNRDHFTTSEGTLKDTDRGAVSLTMKMIQDAQSGSAQVGVGYYNDAEPGKEDSDGYRAHAKGMVAVDSQSRTGVFIMHSVPHYPHILADEPYQYPDTETVHGQSFICVSMDKGSTEEVGEMLAVYMPHYYGVSMPTSVKLWAPTLYKAMVQDYHITPAEAWAGVLKTRGGSYFQAFAKNKKWDQPLWENLVAEAMMTDLYVESWGRPLDEPECKNEGANWTVTNVRDVK
ncbi:deoxyribonuclease II, partial [Kipferlia bialata]|eukprot:g5106.t1